MAQGNVQLAGMGEIVQARGVGMLGCIGLGSCVGTVLFDPRTHSAVLAHVMLPEAHDHDAAQLPGKYATTAVPTLLRMLDASPATASHLKAILIGGGELFQNRSQALRIGERNVEILYRLLRELRIGIVFEHTRGSTGRSFEFDVARGWIKVRAVGATAIERDLAAALGIQRKVA
ncbi:MAG: chemotaxis protein CheD [Fimbriimonadales bacterium]|nr:MAG: chemotaxis protein CheD [Fimbriimonadales bacterium]GIV07740.1 MAG: chemotaxis protein CheD [Fimbriimonadales bacterium]